ncbi:hypothetical protein Tco_0778263, partial [Tanacetum coccineum]
VCNPWSSLIPLSRGSFDVIVEMDWLSKRKFVIVCHEKVVRIPLEGDEILRVHGKRTQGVVKTLMNTKSKEEHEVHLKLVLESLRKEKLYAEFSKLVDALSRKERVKSRRVRGMILAAQSEAFKQENVLAERLRGHLFMGRDWESSLIGPELVLETTDNVVSPWKGVVRFGKKGKLALRYPRQFHVSNLKKCLADASLHVPLDEIKVDKTLRFVEEPVEIINREIKSLKRSKISHVKVH